MGWKDFITQDDISAEHFKKDQLCWSDEILVEPLCGKKRKIKLDRTLVHFVSSVRTNLSPQKQIMLEGREADDFHYVLENVGANHSFIFQFKSLTNRPFRINKVYTHQALVTRGDMIEIGLHTLRFLHPTSDQLDDQKQCSKSLLPVLLLGETGVGKSTLAKRIHEESEVPGHFVHLNLSSFSESLIESELFGHRKGSFTGAIFDKKGAILEAREGTLFLDEIDSLPLPLQVKLLLFLDSGKFRVVGDARETEVKTRLIFAAGKSLKELKECTFFRKDFFYRVSSWFHIEIPGLRKDPNRLQHFVNNYSVENHCIIDGQLIDFYKSCPWPGNLRQLKGHLDKKRALSPKKFLKLCPLDYELLDSDAHQFQSQISSNESHVPSLKKLREIHTTKIFMACGRSISKTAQMLEVTPTTVRSILAKVSLTT